MTAMWMMESRTVATWVRLMMVMNASTGTLTSSWRMELIPSTPLRTKMDLGLTTSAGQEKTNMSHSREHLLEDVHLHSTYTLIQKSRWRQDALVFLQKRPQVVLGLLWCDRVSGTYRSVSKSQKMSWLWVESKFVVFCHVLWLICRCGTNRNCPSRTYDYRSTTKTYTC